MLTPLSFRAHLADYEAQAAALLRAHAARDERALDVIHHKHPRFLDDEVRWLPRPLSLNDIAAAPFDLDDARLTVARGYDYEDWPALAAHVAAMRDPRSTTARFEAAAEATVDGDEQELAALLAKHPDLARARSTRRTCFDPPEHLATLLHYVAANGVENHRQRTPKNAVVIATLLLRAGAEPDALANLYGGECTTMSLLVSSSHPAEAGVQVALIDVLVDFGASVEARGSGRWRSPLITALAFGYRDAAEALVRRGARIDLLAAAAGLGRVDRTRELLSRADADERHAALALASLNGHLAVTRLLLDAGEDPSRCNPEGFHAHATPLHQAALHGHVEMVRLLLSYGARTDAKDTLYHSTPLGWAEHGKQEATAALLRAVGLRTSVD